MFLIFTWKVHLFRTPWAPGGAFRRRGLGPFRGRGFGGQAAGLEVWTQGAAAQTALAEIGGPRKWDVEFNKKIWMKMG